MRRIILVVTVALVFAAMLASASLAATAPAAPVISSPSEGSLVTGSFTLAGTAPTNSVVKVSEVIDGTSKPSYRGDARVSASGEWALPLTGVADGKHAYKAYVTDQATGQNSIWSNTRTVTVDAKAPAAPTLKVGSDTTSYTNGELQEGWLGGIAEPGSKVEVFFQGTLMSTVSTDVQLCSPYGGSTCLNWTTPAEFTLNSANDGQYYFKARATDRAGNVSGWSNNILISVDCMGEGCPVPRGRG
jgi:hypothetical protein